MQRRTIVPCVLLLVLTNGCQRATSASEEEMRQVINEVTAKPDSDVCDTELVGGLDNIHGSGTHVQRRAATARCQPGFLGNIAVTSSLLFVSVDVQRKCRLPPSESRVISCLPRWTDRRHASDSLATCHNVPSPAFVHDGFRVSHVPAPLVSCTAQVLPVMSANSCTKLAVTDAALVPGIRREFQRSQRPDSGRVCGNLHAVPVLPFACERSGLGFLRRWRVGSPRRTLERHGRKCSRIQLC